ncbi:putative transcriptional regulatory protein [Lucilia cuprina]|nr:putative transcriptional regulatory protein [Lucilia cuprina]
MFIGHTLAVKNISTAKYALSAGHSKWANIRHIKAAKDGQKAALFTKISRQIRLAIQEGGSADPSLNSQLKSVIDDALRKNMPMTTIQNNIQKCKQNKNELKRYKIDLRYKQKVFAVCIIYTDNYPGVKMDMATILRKSGCDVVLMCKWGCDGLSSTSRIQTSLWKSTLADYKSESKKTTKDLVEYLKDEINALEPICIKIKEFSINVSYQLSLTMIDGKVSNAMLTELLPSEMLNI